MKKILLLFLLPALACSKDTKPVTCYECEMTYATGDPAAVQYPCTKDIKQWQKDQKDNNGSAITSVCKVL